MKSHLVDRGQEQISDKSISGGRVGGVGEGKKEEEKEEDMANEEVKEDVKKEEENEEKDRGKRNEQRRSSGKRNRRKRRNENIRKVGVGGDVIVNMRNKSRRKLGGGEFIRRKGGG